MRAHACTRCYFHHHYQCAALPISTATAKNGTTLRMDVRLQRVQLLNIRVFCARILRACVRTCVRACMHASV